MKTTMLTVVAVVLMIAVATAVYVLLPSDKNAFDDNTETAASQLSTTPQLIRYAREVESEPISMMDLSGMTIGESFSLYLPQEDRIVAGSIERSRFSKAGNKVLLGKIKDGGQSYSFVVTVGQHQTFGSIQTSRDRYQFELNDGEGELIAQSAINKKRDFSEPDFVIPERREPERVDEN